MSSQFQLKKQVLISPFSNEVRQLLGGNLSMFHIVVEHIKAIVLFSLRQKEVKKRSVSKKERLKHPSPSATDYTLP